MEIETIETVTKGDINDLKAYANAIGVKCENCLHFYYKEYGWCLKKATMVGKKDFCSEFEKEETNGN